MTKAATAETTTNVEFLPAAVVARLVPLSLIRRSPTNHRTRWGDLESLAKDIAVRGVQEPGIGRPKHNEDGQLYVELVAGERRFKASELAGRSEMPLIVRDMSDQEAMEIQYVENFSREDPHPLDEAMWIQDFLKVTSIEEVAARLGKEVDYVNRRLRLLNLGEMARGLFTADAFNLSIAAILATVDELRQEDILRAHFDPNGKALEYVGALTVATARRLVSKLHFLLSRAPFDPKDATLDVTAGACTVCPHNTDTTPALFHDLDSNDATCTKPTCFENKRGLFIQLTTEKARASGLQVLEPQDAAALFKANWNGETQTLKSGKFIDLDEPVEGDSKHRTYDKLIGKKVKEAVVFAVDPLGVQHRLVPAIAVKEPLKKAGIKEPKRGNGQRPSAVQERHQMDMALRKRVFGEVRPLLFAAIAKAPVDFATIMREELFARDLPEDVYAAFKLKLEPKVLEKIRDPKVLARLLWAGQVEQDTSDYSPLDSENIRGICKQLKIPLEKLVDKHRQALKDEKKSAAKSGKGKAKVAKKGVCRDCGCTETTPCDGGCAWTDETETWCTACAEPSGE
jgi:ParB/RepB/Spo0J family partition protein